MLAAITVTIVPLLLGQAAAQPPALAATAAAPETTAPAAATAPVAPPATPADAPADQRSTAALRDAAAAQQRAARLEAELGSVRAQLEAERQRTAYVEQQLADERLRQQQEARAPGERDRAMGTATDDLARAGQALAAGSSDVSDALVQAQALAGEVARSASTTGSPQESALATETQRLLGASQEALQRGDLFQARQALDAALRAAGQARGLAAAGAGAAATAPGAQGVGAASGYSGY